MSKRCRPSLTLLKQEGGCNPALQRGRIVERRLRINRRRQVGDGESPTCFESGRRILRPVFGQIGDKLVVSDVLRPILAHVRTKYSNTQHWIRNLEPQTDKPKGQTPTKESQS